MHQHKHRTACFVADTKGKPCAISEVMPEVLARYGLSMDVPDRHRPGAFQPAQLPGDGRLYRPNLGSLLPVERRQITTLDLVIRM